MTISPGALSNHVVYRVGLCAVCMEVVTPDRICGGCLLESPESVSTEQENRS